MFKRKLYAYLEKWKAQDQYNKKPLVIKGARQVGKTTLVREFAKNNYKHTVYIDFRKDTRLKAAFSGDFDIDLIVTQLTALMPGAKVSPGNTLFIFDEVQDCSDARASLKYFQLDGRYDVICTGSMLGIKGYNRNENNGIRGIPVGFEDIITMYPMDFEEFIWAYGFSSDAMQTVKNCFHSQKAVPQVLHEALLEIFRYYICVGGMPEAVAEFLNTRNLNAVRRVQKRIITEYESDFGSYIKSNGQFASDIILRQKILECFRSIPGQLAKENKKFQYSMIKKAAKGREYREPLDWLEDAGIVSKCFNLSLIQMPLNAYAENNTFKIYMQDTGLFISMLDPGTAGLVLTGELKIFKGSIYENIVADAFSKMGRNLYYFSRSSGLEIDFVTFYEGEICLVEVKATSGDSKSVRTVLGNRELYGVRRCIKLTSQNIGQINNIFTLPYYLTFMLNEASE